MTEIIAVFVGWLLGAVSTLLLEFRADARREAELLSRAYAVGERVFIDSDIFAALHSQGAKRSMSELFEGDSEAAQGIYYHITVTPRNAQTQAGVRGPVQVRRLAHFETGHGPTRWWENAAYSAE
jgi:hypothetical protein